MEVKSSTFSEGSERVTRKITKSFQAVQSPGRKWDNLICRAAATKGGLQGTLLEGAFCWSEDLPTSPMFVPTSHQQPWGSTTTAITEAFITHYTLCCKWVSRIIAAINDVPYPSESFILSAVGWSGQGSAQSYWTSGCPFGMAIPGCHSKLLCAVFMESCCQQGAS